MRVKLRWVVAIAFFLAALGWVATYLAEHIAHRSLDDTAYWGTVLPWVLNAMGVMLTTTSLGQDSKAWWVVPLVLIVGLGIGAVNGLGIVFFEIPPVVMTLGMNGVMEGLVLGLTGGFTCSACNSVVPSSVQGAFTGQVLPGLPNGFVCNEIARVGLRAWGIAASVPHHHPHHDSHPEWAGEVGQ